MDRGIEQPFLNLLWARNSAFHRCKSHREFLPEEGTAELGRLLGIILRFEKLLDFPIASHVGGRQY